MNAENGVVHILGDNGSGKTSILKAIVGINQFNGHVIFNHKDTQRLTAIEKLAIVFCPDKYIFSTVISAKEYLDFCARSYKIQTNDESYNMLVEELGIPKNKLLEEIRNLSYGTVKKILLAATFLPTAKLIVMDEPINGLDTKGKDWLAAKIDKGREEHLFLITCHDKSWLNQFSPQEAWVRAVI